MCWHYVEEAISDALPPESESANVPELPQKLKDAIAAGQVKLECYFSAENIDGVLR